MLVSLLPALLNAKETDPGVSGTAEVAGVVVEVDEPKVTFLPASLVVLLDVSSVDEEVEANLPNGEGFSAEVAEAVVVVLSESLEAVLVVAEGREAASLKVILKLGALLLVLSLSLVDALSVVAAGGGAPKLKFFFSEGAGVVVVVAAAGAPKVNGLLVAVSLSVLEVEAAGLPKVNGLLAAAAAVSLSLEAAAAGVPNVNGLSLSFEVLEVAGLPKVNGLAAPSLSPETVAAGGAPKEKLGVLVTSFSPALEGGGGAPNEKEGGFSDALSVLAGVAPKENVGGLLSFSLSALPLKTKTGALLGGPY